MDTSQLESDSGAVHVLHSVCLTLLPFVLKIRRYINLAKRREDWRAVNDTIS